MDVLAEPLAKRRELTALDLSLQFAEVVGRLLPDLDGHHRAEQVRREVPDQPGRPVHVLEDAVCIIRHFDPEVLVHLLRPALG